MFSLSWTWEENRVWVAYVAQGKLVGTCKCTPLKIALKASAVWRTPRNVLALEETSPEYTSADFFGRERRRSLLLAHPKLVTLVLQ